MNHNEDAFERKSGIPAHPERMALAVSAAGGAAMGAAIAFFAAASWLGVLLGAFIGAVAGAVIARFARERWKREQVKEEVFDREIGVIGGDIGAAQPRAGRAASPAAPSPREAMRGS